MKRYGNLFSSINSWENLVLAARRAARAKPMSREKMAFEFNMEDLHEALEEITGFMQDIRLKLHERKTVVFPAKRGLTFLGFRLYPGKVLAGKRCGKRFRARLKQMQKEYARGEIDLKGIKQVIASYNGHLAHGATKKLRAGILNGFPFVRAGTG